MKKPFEERPTEGMPDMMPKGTVDNPPQKEPQDIPVRMKEQPYESPDEIKEKKEDTSVNASKARMDERMSDWGDSECGC